MCHTEGGTGFAKHTKWRNKIMIKTEASKEKTAVEHAVDVKVMHKREEKMSTFITPFATILLQVAPLLEPTESHGAAGLHQAEKCALRQRKVHFLGHEIDTDGVWPYPAIVSAISELSPPETFLEFKWVLGIVNYLGKYVPRLATVGHPLYELLKSKAAWTWGQRQQFAFNR